jgi:uncharacterized membrane protein YgcG
MLTENQKTKIEKCISRSQVKRICFHLDLPEAEALAHFNEHLRKSTAYVTAAFDSVASPFSSGFDTSPSTSDALSSSDYSGGGGDFGGGGASSDY